MLFCTRYVCVHLHSGGEKETALELSFMEVRVERREVRVMPEVIRELLQF